MIRLYLHLVTEIVLVIHLFQFEKYNFTYQEVLFCFAANILFTIALSYHQY